ncbi:uroporphyrinogen-III synthase [Amnibacterium kyonggiense]|uniref:Uroporphyrinogen-III synthase n=1 Tax=Amnibacterium kyonggiense TaxID=595671 RepID=A0A4R7FPY8_9MICO|nr:uroporphyrinogen-III synthase [Amnibacterium kyonggiense]TDS79783.1 uroporphyrinogen-III synthase [Amnibacterium kyonggiense]
MTGDKPLRGWKVLVPRGGPWGHGVAAELRLRGANPVVAPSINFAGTADGPALDQALTRLTGGEYDWMSVTSATTVDVLSAHRVVLPERTKVAAVGETTAAALGAAGYRVDFVPRRDNSAAGLLAEWGDATEGVVPLRILALRSDIAKPVLTDGLRAAGHDVDSVVAYRTVGVPIAPETIAQVASGQFDAILITSGSVANQISMQIGLVPSRTIIACIGPRTAVDAEAAGLRVDLVARERSSESLIDTLEELALHRPMQGPLP